MLHDHDITHLLKLSKKFDDKIKSQDMRNMSYTKKM